MNGIAQEADRQLRELRAARDAATTNLLDLEREGAYALLKAGNGLSGVTAARAEPALARVPELWSGLQLLDEVIDRAEKHRGDGHLNDARARELLTMLTGPSITLPVEVRPLAQRALTASPTSTPTLTPQALLAAMEEAFAALRDVIAAVDAAWTELLPRLERATAEAVRLAGEMPGHRDVTAARAALARLADRIAEDPLGAADELARAEALLAAARQAAAQARALAGRVRDDLVAAERSATEIAALIDEGRIGLAESRRTVADPSGLLDPLDPTVLTGERGLEPWLARLRRLAEAGQVERAAAGMARWRSLADQTLTAARQVAEANAEPAARRRELRGLLRAARAKAVAAGRVEDGALRDIEQRAREALEVPCDLAAAQSEVDAYIAALRRGPRRKPQPADVPTTEKPA